MTRTKTESSSDVAAVQGTVADWRAAVNAGDADRLVALSSAELEMISPDEEPVRGEAAHQVLRDFLREFTVELAPFVDEEIFVSGDLAYQRYTYRWQLTSNAGGGSVVERGHGIHLLERQSDGSWRVLKDVYNVVRA